MWHRRVHEEEGVALVYVLLASVIISGLVVVFMQRSLFEMRSTSAAASWESAIHVAEAGAEALFGKINGEGEEFEEKVVTEGPDEDENWGPHVYDPDPDWDDAELRAYERTWAVGLARADWDLAQESDYKTRVIETDDGHAFGIRPIKPNGENEVWDIVFGVAFVPSINHTDPTVRLVKMQINQFFFQPDHALLVGGSLRFGGNASIRSTGCDPVTNRDACDADVHTNGNVTRSGGGTVNVDGAITATGSTDGVNSRTGPALPGESPIVIPNVRARDFYGRDHVVGQEGWYDLCPDGRVRERAATPCDGDVLWSSGSGTPDYLGWKHITASGNHLPKWSATAVKSGVFYVHHGNAEVTGSVGRTEVSILVAADPDNPDKTGSMEIAGNPTFDAAISDVLFVTDADLRLRGTGTSAGEHALAGFIYVGEQLAASANITVDGAIIVADRTDEHPWVQRTSNQGSNAGAHVTGNMTLNYARNMELNLSGMITIEFWNEL